MKRFFAFAAVSALSLTVPTMAFASGGKNCSDFKTWSEAQSYFESHGGSKTNNVDGLDRDRDGIVCESLKGFDSGHQNPNNKPTTPEGSPKPTPSENPKPTNPYPSSTASPNPSGAPLPKTASSFGNMMLLGTVLAAGGSALLLKNKQTT